MRRALLSCDLRWTVLMVALSCLGACTETQPATSIVVAIRAENEAVATQLASLHVQLYPVGADSDADPVEDRSYSLTQGAARAGQWNLPISFGIEKGKADRFLLVVTGFRNAEREPFIEQKVIASFQRRRTLLLEVVLASVCVDRASACTSLEETCHATSSAGTAAGTCGPVLEPTLRPIRPGQELDGGVSEAEEAGLDGASGDASGRTDGQADASGTEGGMDAASSDAGDSGAGDSGARDASGNDTGTDADAAAPEFAIATSGTACATSGAKACDAHNGRQKLICFNGLWSPNGSCDGDTRCQTQLGSPDVGSCVPVVAPCVGKRPGDAICDGTTRRACGLDLLDFTNLPCPVHATCHDQAGSVSCSCDSPYMDDGSGVCTTQYCQAMPCMNGGICNAAPGGRTCDCSAVDYEGTSCETKIDDCAKNPCLHGGLCTDGVRSRSCACGADSGFTGASCETNVNECAGPNVCSGTTNGVAFSYVCKDYSGDVPGYTCVGQFPDWQVTTQPPARFAVANGVVADAQTGLQWQQTVDSATYAWADAKSHCESLTLSGGGWRLPTRAELLSIVDFSRTNPALDDSVFPGTPVDRSFWTATAAVADQNNPDPGWLISFVDGTSRSFARININHVRCVR